MSTKFWLNPPRGGGVRWVEPNINPTAYYKYGNYKQRVWRFPINTTTDLNPMARHWMMDLSYVKGTIIHQRSTSNLNHKYIRKPFTWKWAESIYYKQVTGKLHTIPWIMGLYVLFCTGMRAYDNSAYDYYYFTD
mmetsp:Transcript_831/g.1858  ORF Transcript_831/g.1858 Transcript_831/m.1858 type:complete len:134 (+) Transcript_831:5171-5572(+)